MPDIKKLPSNIRNHFSQRRELGYVINSYGSKEDLFHAVEETLNALEKDAIQLVKPPIPEDVEPNGGRVVSDITLDSITTKCLWFGENLGLLKEYATRLQESSKHFKKDTKLQIINSLYSGRVNSLETQYHTLYEACEFIPPLQSLIEK